VADFAARRPPWLGLVAACLGVLLVFWLHGGEPLLFAAAPGFEFDDPTGLGIMVWTQGVGMVLVFALGLVAAVLGRGRWFGVLAMAIALFDNAFLQVALHAMNAPPMR
jgi:hypothetical protein